MSQGWTKPLLYLYLNQQLLKFPVKSTLQPLHAGQTYGSRCACRAVNTWRTADPAVSCSGAHKRVTVKTGTYRPGPSSFQALSLYTEEWPYLNFESVLFTAETWRTKIVGGKLSSSSDPCVFPTLTATSLQKPLCLSNPPSATNQREWQRS